jgi:hypothetical protein
MEFIGSFLLNANFCQPESQLLPTITNKGFDGLFTPPGRPKALPMVRPHQGHGRWVSTGWFWGRRLGRWLRSGNDLISPFEALHDDYPTRRLRPGPMWRDTRR